MSVPLYSNLNQPADLGATEDDFADDQFGKYGRTSTHTRPSISYVNESGLPDDVVDRHFRRGKGFTEIANVIEKWSQSLSGHGSTQTLDVFNRNRGLQDKLHIHATMARCAWSVENDDVLSTLADVVEGLMWQKNGFELFDSDEQSFWNQWAGDVNLDRFLRQCGREEFKISQFYVGVYWGKKVYKVKDDQILDTIKEFDRVAAVNEYERQLETHEALVEANKGNPDFVAPPAPLEPEKKAGPGKGNRKRKKTFPVEVPLQLTILDPTKVMPVGTLMFGRERFAYIASEGESGAFSRVMAGEVVDDTVLQLIQEKYEPTAADKAACAEVGVDHTRLWLMRPESCFRHTMTKSEYERYAAVRLKTILPILEMKGHLRSSDRATLIGNTNFIVVITKGTDKLPAKPSEVANLQEQARVIARLPVLVGDHRLNVEIVSPDTTNVLQDSRWQVLDARLVFAALRTFAPVTQGGNSSGAGAKEMSQIVGTGLQSRRHMISRTLEEHLFGAIMAKNEGVLREFPTLAFRPKRITLDFNQDIINGILKLRDRGDISRETALEELDYDQDTEVLRRAREKALYDDVFKSSTPHSSPTANPFQAPSDQQQPGGNVGPNGQPRTEGGRPPGVTEEQPRRTGGN